VTGQRSNQLNYVPRLNRITETTGGGRREPAIFGSVMIARKLKNWQGTTAGKSRSQPGEGKLCLRQHPRDRRLHMDTRGIEKRDISVRDFAKRGFAKNERQLGASQNQTINVLLLPQSIDD
jgi:hypothetical protein